MYFCIWSTPIKVDLFLLYTLNVFYAISTKVSFNSKYGYFYFFLNNSFEENTYKTRRSTMNCIGHSFTDNENALPKIKAFLDRINSPKILATTDDIRLCRVSIEFSTNKIIRGKELMLIRNKEWVEEISNTTATLNLDDNMQIENIILHLKMLLRKLDILIFKEKVKSIDYECFNESYKSYGIQCGDKATPRTNEDFKSLILDYELSA